MFIILVNLYLYMNFLQRWKEIVQFLFTFFYFLVVFNDPIFNFSSAPCCNAFNVTLKAPKLWDEVPEEIRSASQCPILNLFLKHTFIRGVFPDF